MIDDKTTEAQLDAMQADGFRGSRINLATGGVNDPNVGRARFTAAVERMKARGWHVQLYTTLPMISAIKELVLASPVPAVFDHFGGPRRRSELEQPGFSDLVALVKSGKAYVKISGAYRSSNLAPDYQDMVPFARALIAANADRIVWGTDWPHPDSSPVEGRKPTDIAPFFRSKTAGCSTSFRCGRRMRRCARRSWSTIPRVSTDSEPSARAAARRRRSAPATSPGSRPAPASCR